MLVMSIEHTCACSATSSVRAESLGSAAPIDLACDVRRAQLFQVLLSYHCRTFKSVSRDWCAEPDLSSLTPSRVPALETLFVPNVVEALS
jgi:hypothetical protein